jgi:hypothetical protein
MSWPRAGRRSSRAAPRFEGTGGPVVRSPRSGAAAKLAASFALAGAIALGAIGWAVFRGAAVDAGLARALAETARADRVAEELFDRFAEREFPRPGASAAPTADTGPLDAAAVAAVAPGLVARVEKARDDLASPGRLAADGGSPGDRLAEIRDLRDAIEDAARLRFRDAATRAGEARASVLAELAGLVGVALASAFLLARAGVSVPIARLARALETQSADGFRAPPPGLERLDEAGRIARSWQDALAAISARAEAEADRAARLRRQEAEKLAAENLSASETQARVLRAAGAAVQRLAAGDLTARLGEALGAAEPRLARDFDAGLGRLA